mmetsp:Transcript_27080/g.78868  ORF Transcript_27080/g.78868 Transcript_27080/m.78868 type:complete len:88 (-) Transcript_27080:340-603(-)
MLMLPLCVRVWVFYTKASFVTSRANPSSWWNGLRDAPPDEVFEYVFDCPAIRFHRSSSMDRSSAALLLDSRVDPRGRWGPEDSQQHL